MTEPTYQIRGVLPGDLDALAALASHLDSVNLPADRPEVLEETIALSGRSFSGDQADRARRQHTFVIEHLPSGRVVGTSAVRARVGRRDAPHIYFDVRVEERYSETLDRHFRHEKLQIGFSYDGPTGIGGLVVDPAHRRTPGRVGTQIALARFLFIAMRRGDFRDRLVAELLPPLEPDGTSHLWEAVGRRFTGLTYREADRLSKNNKEFVRSLFPDGDIYAPLLDPEAQAVIGEVGDQTRGVARLLGQVGFRYAHRVDPFDGGPYFEAATDRVHTIRQARRVTPRPGADPVGGPALVGRCLDKPPWFRAVMTPQERLDEEGILVLPRAALELLEAGTDATPVWVAPLPETHHD